MRVIGITGGVGAGKSAVLRYLSGRWQAQTVLTDEAGHLVMEPGEACYEQIVERFGREMLLPDKKIDRKKLGELVFSNQEKLEELCSLVHPAVKKYVLSALSEAEKEGKNLFIIESALLFDEDYDAICDEVWYIYAGESVRTERLRKDRGYSDERIRGILSSQASEEFFRNRCDCTIENNGDFTETCRQIDERIRKL